MAKRFPLLALAKNLFPEIVFTGNKNHIYLSFDDGPHPETTEWLCKLLLEKKMNATFFFSGLQAETYPELVSLVKNAGFSIAHHGWEHFNGWKTENQIYDANCRKSGDLLNTNIFRPPYGKISPLQYLTLKKHQKIILWSLLSRDYDPSLSEKELLSQLCKNTSGGDIVVFHENDKSAKKLKNILPTYLDFITSKGWQTGLIGDLV